MDSEMGVVEKVGVAAIIFAEVLVLFDQHDRENGGPGLIERGVKMVDKVKNRYLKPWHFPKKWRRMKSEVVIEAWTASEGK